MRLRVSPSLLLYFSLYTFPLLSLYTLVRSISLSFVTTRWIASSIAYVGWLYTLRGVVGGDEEVEECHQLKNMTSLFSEYYLLHEDDDDVGEDRGGPGPTS